MEIGLDKAGAIPPPPHSPGLLAPSWACSERRCYPKVGTDFPGGSSLSNFTAQTHCICDRIGTLIVCREGSRNLGRTSNVIAWLRIQKCQVISSPQTPPYIHHRHIFHSCECPQEPWSLCVSCGQPKTEVSSA